MQGERNHVEISCKISHWASENGKYAPVITRMGYTWNADCLNGLRCKRPFNLYLYSKWVDLRLGIDGNGFDLFGEMLGYKMLNRAHWSSFPIEFEKYLNSDEDECNGLWLSSSDFSVHLTKFHKHETKYLNSDLEDTRCGYEFVVLGNMIPSPFMYKIGGSISFLIGSKFQSLALGFAFDLLMGNTYSYVCDVHISINGFKRELKVQLFEEMSIDHLWFYYIPQISLQQLFRDLNLGFRNFVK
ncbi:hypothetical protein CFP56_026044, partial [Quercus suber]